MGLGESGACPNRVIRGTGTDPPAPVLVILLMVALSGGRWGGFTVGSADFNRAETGGESLVPVPTERPLEILHFR